MADLVAFRFRLIAKKLHELCGKHSGFDRLGHNMGGHEKALIQRTVIAHGAAALTADAGHREPLGGRLHQIGATGDIAAGGRQSAARVLDEGADHKVCTHLGGLQRLHKLAVAVIHQHSGIGVIVLDKLWPAHRSPPPRAWHGWNSPWNAG